MVRPTALQTGEDPSETFVGGLGLTLQLSLSFSAFGRIPFLGQRDRERERGTGVKGGNKEQRRASMRSARRFWDRRRRFLGSVAIQRFNFLSSKEKHNVVIDPTPRARPPPLFALCLSVSLLCSAMCSLVFYSPTPVWHSTVLFRKLARHFVQCCSIAVQSDEILCWKIRDPSEPFREFGEETRRERSRAKDEPENSIILFDG